MGSSAWKPIELIDDDFFDKLINVNLKGIWDTRSTQMETKERFYYQHFKYCW